MFNVTKNKTLLLVLPLLIIVAGVAGYFVNGGFNEDVDFMGGISMHIDAGEAVDTEVIEAAFTAVEGTKPSSVQRTLDNTSQVILKAPPLVELEESVPESNEDQAHFLPVDRKSTRLNSSH